MFQTNTNSIKRHLHIYNREDPVIGSCELLVLHPDDKCFLKVPFHVVSVEGSVIVSCATSIKLNLIQIHNELDTNVPDCARLYYSSFDKPRTNHEKEKEVGHAVISDKNCQETNMWSVHLIPQTYGRLCQDPTCQSTRCRKKISDPQKRQKI